MKQEEQEHGYVSGLHGGENRGFVESGKAHLEGIVVQRLNRAGFDVERRAGDPMGIGEGEDSRPWWRYEAEWEK